MSTSGSTNYNLVRDEIIAEAYELLGVDPANPLEAIDISSADRSLNLMIKAWQADDVFLWKESQATLILDYNQTKYTLYSSGDHCSETVIRTQLASALTAAATSVTVDSTTGMTVGDYIGIKQDTGYLYWTTIATIPTSTTLTLTAGITSAAAANNWVYTYTTKIGKPLLIKDARRRDNSGLQDTPLTSYARSEYLAMPNKSQLGDPIAFYYQPNRVSTDFYCYLTPSSSIASTVEFSCYKTVEDFDNSSDDPDFPVEWLECICLNLAKRLALKLGKDPKLIQSLGPMADASYQTLKDWSQDISNSIIVPNLKGTGYSK